MTASSGKMSKREGAPTGSARATLPANGPAGPERQHHDAVGAPPGDGGDNPRTLIDALVTSRIYQDYERAFTEATGLPVALRPVESWQLPHHGKRGESPFCAMVAGKSKACAVCLQVQEKLVSAAMEEP